MTTQGTPIGPVDSLGVPWRGRTPAPSPFSEDDGAPDAGLLAALTGYAAGAAGAREVVAALGGARVFVPVMATSGEGRRSPDQMPGQLLDQMPGQLPDQTPGQLPVDRVPADRARGDAGAEMSLALLTDADGRRALPVFSSLGSLAAWNDRARPVPVEAARAALSAVADGCQALVVDAAGPATFVVGRTAVWALAQGREWLPSAQDPQVHQAVEEAAHRVRHVRRVRCEPGVKADLAVILGIPVGLAAAELDVVLDEVQRRLVGNDVVAERVDSLELRVLPA